MSGATVPLSAVGLADRSVVGTKAAALGELLRHGLPVPDGFVVLSAEGFDGGCPGSWAGRWLARSSAAVEDGGQASFAGQLESLADLWPGGALREAVRRVSVPSERARAYAARVKLELPATIPVLVEQQVEAERAGVLFTVDPTGGARLRFAIDWGAPAEVTDGGGESHHTTFDPLDPSGAGVGDPHVARALAALVDHAFQAAGLLRAEGPLDLEWVLDRNGGLWVVQARPVTAYRRAPHPGLESRLAEGFHLASPRPLSALASWSFGVAAAVDRRAGGFHPAYFERALAGPWALARRTKQRERERIGARSALAFTCAWAWTRRKNLRFAARAVTGWETWGRIAVAWARRTLRVDVSRLSSRGLARLLAQALAQLERARSLHAALWYPVDLVKDLAELREARGQPPDAPGLPGSRVRSERDRDTARLVLELRAGRREHPGWDELSEPERARVLAHLARHPYAFGSTAEVQDLSAWRAWPEEPDRWWGGWAHASHEELGRQAAIGSGRSASAAPEARGWADLAEAPLRWTASMVAPLKDDRVELLALVASAARRVLLELERRQGEPGALPGWIFELHPAELRALASRPGGTAGLYELAQRRLRVRWLEQFNLPGGPRPAAAAPAVAVGGERAGTALAGGLATGSARRVRDAAEAWRALRPGEVLVTDEIRPAFTAVLPRAAALVCRRGSPLSHAAVVARELGIPAVALPELETIGQGALLRVDGDRGAVTLL